MFRWKVNSNFGSKISKKWNVQKRNKTQKYWLRRVELGKDLESWILVEFVLVHFIQFLNYFFQKIQVFTNSWNLLEFFVVQNSRKFNSLIDKKLELEDIFERLHKIESFEIKVGEQTWFKMITTVKNCIVFKINEVLSPFFWILVGF